MYKIISNVYLREVRQAMAQLDRAVRYRLEGRGFNSL